MPMGNRLAAGYLAEYLHHKGQSIWICPLSGKNSGGSYGGIRADLPSGCRMRHKMSRWRPTLYLLEQDIAEIRRVFEIGLKAASERKTRKRL